MLMMMMPPLLRYSSLQSAVCSLQSAVCGLQSANVIHRSITTQRQVWATSLLSQIRQLYYALVAKEVVTESIDSRQKRKKGPNRSCAKKKKGREV